MEKPAPGSPRISIIAPIRNVAHYIGQMLESVIAQTYADWELLVMDGASNDGTLEIVNGYAAKHPNIIVRSEKDESAWHAVDKGLKAARGEFITIICGQDGLFDKTWLAECAKTFDAHPDVSLVWGVNIAMSEDGTLASEIHPSYSHLTKKESRASGAWQLAKKGASVAKELLVGDPVRKKYLREKLFSKTARLKLNLLTARSFPDGKVPQKEDWFPYWLETGLVFPDQSMVMDKKIFLECTPPYKMGSKSPGNLTDFYFNFNARGYLAYYIPIVGSFGRFHENQSAQAYSEEMHSRSEEYFRKVVDFGKALKKKHEVVLFRGRNGEAVGRKQF